MMFIVQSFTLTIAIRGVIRKLKRGGGRSFLFPFPLKIPVKTKKKGLSLLSSSNLPPRIKLSPKKTGHRVLGCPVSAEALTGDIYLFQQG